MPYPFGVTTPDARFTSHFLSKGFCQTIGVENAAAKSIPGCYEGRRILIMKKTASQNAESGSHEIDARIAQLADWRGDMLARIRAVINQADPDVEEECKWKKPSNPRGVPVWSHNGMICTGETHKSVVKTTFAKGAFLPDPSGLFNSSLDGNLRRAIDFHQGDKIDEKALKALIRAAVALNMSKP